MFKEALQRTSPESMGISSEKLLKMVRELEECQGTEMHGLMITRHGKVILEGFWSPYTPEGSHICHSMGKSYIGTAAGLAITDGLLHLDDHIVDLFKEEIEAFGIVPNDNMKKLTIEHVLKMSNGMSIHPASGENLLLNYLGSEFDLVPGEKFLYNTTGSCMLGAAVTKVTGMSVRDYLGNRIFSKIGVESDQLNWLRFHKNNVHAAPGVASSTENNLRLGMLYLNKGEWNGEQLIDREWMEKATSRQILTSEVNKEAHLDNGAGYGYQLWICEEKDTFKFSGGHGQDVIMSRPHDLAISVNQAAYDKGYNAQEAVLKKYLLQPDSFSEEALQENPRALKELQTYLSNLSIKDRKAMEPGTDLRDWEGNYILESGEMHINTELRPYDSSNVYTDFYDHDDVNTKRLSIADRGKYLELVFDDGTITSRIEAYKDGKLRPVSTRGAIPSYRETVSAAHMEEDSLVVETKFLMTCFWTILKFRKAGNRVEVTVLKERLHESDPYIIRSAVLKQ